MKRRSGGEKWRRAQNALGAKPNGRLCRKTNDRYLKLSEPERKKARETLNRALNQALEATQQLQDSHVRAALASFIASVFDQVGWADPGVDKKKDKSRRENAATASRLSGLNGRISRPTKYVQAAEIELLQPKKFDRGLVVVTDESYRL